MKFNNTVIVTIGNEYGTVSYPLWIVLMIKHRGITTTNIAIIVIIR
ncbi:hypothetical protein GCM10009000_060370 [Halobacterium noricense]